MRSEVIAKTLPKGSNLSLIRVHELFSPLLKKRYVNSGGSFTFS